MLQDGHQLAQLVQALQLDARRPQLVVQQRAERVNQRGLCAAIPPLLREEVLEQLVLRSAHLHGLAVGDVAECIPLSLHSTFLLAARLAGMAGALQRTSLVVTFQCAMGHSCHLVQIVSFLIVAVQMCNAVQRQQAGCRRRDTSSSRHLQKVGAASAREGWQRLPGKRDKPLTSHIGHQAQAGCAVGCLAVRQQLAIFRPYCTLLNACQQACARLDISAGR